MKTKGVRILDKINRCVSVKLSDILIEIKDGNLLHWSILDFEGRGNLGLGKSISAFERQIDNSEKGLFVTWNELNILSIQFEDIYDILIIGGSNREQLHKYENDQDMYETCDIVIEKFDSSFWEVFSKNQEFISRITSKFKEVKFLESNFEK